VPILPGLVLYLELLGLVWYMDSLVLFGTYTAWLGLVPILPGLVWCLDCLVWFGTYTAWFGLVWYLYCLVWFGSYFTAWFGLVPRLLGLVWYLDRLAQPPGEVVDGGVETKTGQPRTRQSCTS
jgi:hypothetical protein